MPFPTIELIAIYQGGSKISLQICIWARKSKRCAVPMPNKINTKAQLIKQTKSTNSIWDLKCIRRISKTVLCWGSVCPNLQSKSAAQLLGDKWCSAFNSNDAKLKWFLCDNPWNNLKLFDFFVHSNLVAVCVFCN